MPSVQRFFSGHDNLARSALLAASSVRASTAIERVAASRAGGGRARLAGSYTGHEAAAVDVEIVAAGGVPRASVPQFTGVGNGQLAVQSVGAAAPLQSITLTLADLGVPTATAGLDVREVRIRAKVAGSAGNSLRITVVPQTVRTATAWALLADWSAGSAVQTGPQWDFGGLPLSPKDELDGNSGRIAFGFDPQVYRPWRKFKDGQWQHGLSPPLERSVAAGTPVYAVTGGYLVTVTDGVATETFGDTAATPVPQPAIVTFYDLLSALAASSLVEVAGVVAMDRAAGGQAAIDVPLRTSAWLLALGGKVRLADVGVPANAPTQTLTLRCTNADTVGAERWSVAGDVSGTLAPAATGVPYVSAAAHFTLPRIDPAALGSGLWSVKLGLAQRPDDAGVPSICLRPVRLGVNAAPKTVTFEYRKRPPADCNCSDAPTPRLSLACLGLNQGSADMALDPAYKSRLQSVYGWREQFIRDNTLVRPGGTFPGTPDWSHFSFFSRVAVAAYETGKQVFVEAVQQYASASAAQDGLDAVTGQTIPSGTLINQAFTLNGVTVRLAAIYGMGSSTITDADVNYWYQGEVNEYVQPGSPAVSVGVGYIAYKRDLSWMERAIDVILPGLRQVYEDAVALGAWDDLWAEVQADLELLRAASDEIKLDADADARFLDRYRAAVDNILLSIGIVPKSEPSSGDAGSCWVDHGGTHWWVDAEGVYLPAFTNQAYVSARRHADTGKPYSTMEFGFGLVVACPERLAVGDSVTLRIEQVDGERPYRVGDEAIIQTIGAGPAWLAGGVDGTDVQTWRVAGSVSGPLADYVVPTDGTPAPTYSAAGVDLKIALGGIAFALGDVFSLAVEAGQFRWRRDGGAWSAAADIPASGPAVLADGLALHFDAGAAPSFVPGDAYSYAVHQPWAASHVRDAQATAWGWAGAAGSMTIDLGAVQTVGALALARYSLPPGAAVTAELSDDGVAWGAPLALDVSRAVGVRLLGLQARFIRLTVAGAPDGSIGWVWAGEPLATEHHASSCQRRRRWAVRRSDGVNAAGLYAGAGDGWQLGWQNALRDGDADALLERVNWAQIKDEPLILLPHHLHPEDAALVRCAPDALELSDVHEYQPDDAGQRLLSAMLELEPVFA